MNRMHRCWNVPWRHLNWKHFFSSSNIPSAHHIQNQGQAALVWSCLGRHSCDWVRLLYVCRVQQIGVFFQLKLHMLVEVLSHPLGCICGRVRLMCKIVHYGQGEDRMRNNRKLDGDNKALIKGILTFSFCDLADQHF